MKHGWVSEWLEIVNKHKLIYLGLGIHLLFFFSAFGLNWFDYFFTGASLHHCCKGLDFYQIPQGAYAFLHGGSLSGALPPNVPPYIREPFGINNNVYHPLLTLLLGGLFIQVPPLSAFYLWMYLKLLLTLWLVSYFYRQFKDNQYIDLAIFLMLVNFTQYLEIRISQYHFLMNFFLWLLLINLVKNKDSIAGGFYLFVDLLVKPVGVLWMPVLFFKKHYWVIAAAIILFLIATVPFIRDHSGSYYTDNLINNIIHANKFGPNQIMTLDALLRYNSIPEQMISFLKYCFLGGILVLSMFKRVSVVKGIFLTIVYYLLFYDRVFEYHYTTLIPILSICLVTEKAFQTRFAKILMLIMTGPTIFFLLHFLHIGYLESDYLGTDLTPLGWELIILNRIIPLLLLTGAVLLPDLRQITSDLMVFLRQKK